MSEAARQALRRDPAARKIARAWRVLTGGGRNRDSLRKTLLACSGGADSAALVLALSAHAKDNHRMCVGHIVHDIRPRNETHAERNRVKELALALGLRYLDRSVRTRRVKGNTEAIARERRYAALVDIAATMRLKYIATAHQGDDLVETVLMRLVRGTGVRGLVGIHESREMEDAPALTLIRPMLAVTRADAERICEIAGWTPNDDPTNRDTTRLRSRIRHDVLPVLRDVAPGVHSRVLETSRVMSGIADMIETAAESRSPAPPSNFAREHMRGVSPVVLAEMLRAWVRDAGGPLDRLSARTLTEACRVIQGHGTSPRLIRLPNIEVRVTAHAVSMRSNTK